MENNFQADGLTSREAMHTLCREIELVLHQFKSSQKTRKSRSYIKDSLHHTSQYATSSWITILCILWIVINMIVAHFFQNYNDSMIYMGVLIGILGVLNVAMELRDHRMKYEEIPMRVEALLQDLRYAADRIKWSPDCFLPLSLPFSPCITLQWTYRDNSLVNLPWSLLVKDDIICLKPGQVSPGYCEAVEKSSEFQLLHAKEIYAPPLHHANEIFSAPKIRKPLEYKKYRLLETPYLNNLRMYLEQSLDRPITQFNQQKYFIIRRVCEIFVLPLLLIILYVISILRYFYWDMYFGEDQTINIFMIMPITCLLPLTFPLFPLAWMLLNYYGIARLKTIFDKTKNQEKYENSFEDDAFNEYSHHFDADCDYKSVLNNLLKAFKGDPDIIFRTTNILHVLGSVTALCCVDKKGILSWPNPTAEKIFFLRNANSASNSTKSHDSSENMNESETASVGSHCHFNADSPHTAVAEVLDLTHNHKDPFKLHFDDPNWQRYLSSLKPLGLGILLNTCNLETQEHYTAFCSHITCEAMYNENLVPVTNRRCLCELAKEIGFVDEAQNIFSLEKQLSTFRHLQPEMVRRDNKYARSLQLSTRLKFPFPHMFAVIVKEINGESMQLLSEGTADIILDSCVDYWDGQDLRPLSNADRKKIQDFYQRCSLTAYCTAFAYRPLRKFPSDKLTEVYLELPSDSRHLYTNHRSPTPAHWESKSLLDPKSRSHGGQFHSTDSLLYNNCPSETPDAESCFQIQCNQIFIGMVTMQYQALLDMVQLIEQLEKACIRFVHFSKENELRSRVFSEKMGLESGWNCHISLLSDKTSNLEFSRAMSFSAPSAINLDHSVVKFDKSLDKLTKNSYDLIPDLKEHNVSSQETVHIQDVNSTSHDWQSLSCLTDSTEHSAPINFDMSNRAKLPRGIEKIRPHIESIDNVPLLVSLFTDCTPATTREMIQIMQDYGEVVCLIGSSANCDNAGVFMQADASIAIEPLYPQFCQRYKVVKKNDDIISPTEIARNLNSIASSVSIKREDPISIHRLIMESRHYMKLVWNSVQFWLSCSITMMMLQLLSMILMLPAVVTLGQLVWFCCLVVPLLSISLMGSSIDRGVMKKPQGKNQMTLTINLMFFICWCYGTKFLPTVLIVLASYIGILTQHCRELCSVSNCTCLMYHTPYYEELNVGGWSESTWTLSIVRLIIGFIILTNFVALSIGFIHRDYLIFRRFPLKNILWLGIASLLVIMQGIYTTWSFISVEGNFDETDRLKIPLWVILVVVLSPLIVFCISEITKFREILVNKRFQKRARLEFGTKLGMNSPF